MGDLRRPFRSHQKNADSQVMHTLKFRGLTVRAIRPFDWLGYLRGWGLEFAEVRETGGVYQKSWDRSKRRWARILARTCPTIGRSSLTKKPRSRSWSARGARKFRPTFPARSGTMPVVACWPSHSTTREARSRRPTTSVAGPG